MLQSPNYDATFFAPIVIGWNFCKYSEQNISTFITIKLFKCINTLMHFAFVIKKNKLKWKLIWICYYLNACWTLWSLNACNKNVYLKWILFIWSSTIIRFSEVGFGKRWGVNERINEMKNCTRKKNEDRIKKFNRKSEKNTNKQISTRPKHHITRNNASIIMQKKKLNEFSY